MAITPAGIIGTLLIATVIVVCVRLGVWQLSRLEQRRELNAGIAARMDAPPIQSADQLADTAGLHFRVATIRGRFDNDRSIILPGRSYRGMPGVHLLTPLRLDDRPQAVLVNRGWVPSADAASLDIEQLQLPDTATVRGIVLPFPTRAESLALRDTTPPPTGFRRVWFSIDERALRAQFPYPLLPATVQELPIAGDDRRAPTRLPPPLLDEGSHLGYALQWFAFAAIAFFGWLALVLRGRAPRRAPPPAIAIVLLLAAHPAAAQLRPHEPIEWRIFDRDVFLVADAGFGMLWDQPATLAGADGRLLEVGTYGLAIRSGRIAIELGGTALWHFRERTQTGTPATGVRPATDGVRRDAGVASVSTAFRMSLPDWTTDVVVRFGASIPTTSDESGLDRDRTDVFATLALRHPIGPLTVWMENGVGIHGTLWSHYPQSDVWTFGFGAAWAAGPIRTQAMLVGRQDGHSWVVQGNEDQHELRVGFDVGRTRWLGVYYIRGLSEFSPGRGVRVGAGFLLDTFPGT